MATGEIKISGLPLDVDPTQDDYAVTVDVDTNTNKKVPLGELSKALDYTNSLSSDADNLMALGTDDRLRVTAQDELISSDASNTLSVGSDGKLYGSATALSLNENELFVGNASNQPVSTSANDVRQVLGLPTDYIKDDIQYVSANQVSWQGKCRDSSDSRDFELGSATTASLVGAVANTTYNLFVAGNTLTDTPVVVWDIGSTPAGYTYYRRVGSFITDGVGSLFNFISHSYTSGAKKIQFLERITLYNGTGANGLLFNSVAPTNTDIELSIFGSKAGSGSVRGIVDASDVNLSVPTIEGQGDVYGAAALASSGSTTNKTVRNRTSQLKLTSSGTFSLLQVALVSYTDERI